MERDDEALSLGILQTTLREKENMLQRKKVPN